MVILFLMFLSKQKLAILCWFYEFGGNVLLFHETGLGTTDLRVWYITVPWNFLNLDTFDILSQIFLCYGGPVVLCMVGCLTVSLASTHWIPVTTHPTLMQQLKMSSDIGQCLKMSWGWGRWGRGCAQKVWKLLLQKHCKVYFIIIIFISLVSQNEFLLQ